MPKKTKPKSWESKIVELVKDIDPSTLTPHPMNPKNHPEAQREAIGSALGSVGWIAPLIVNQRTGLMIDGHGRREEAIKTGNTVPVLYVDLTEDEEREMLATYDPISYLAQYDPELTKALVAGLTLDPTMAHLMGQLASEAVDVPAFEPHLTPDGTAWSPGSFADGEAATAAKFADGPPKAQTIVCPHCFEEFGV